MATLHVQPRNTPAERDDHEILIEVDPQHKVHAEVIEDWAAPRPNWEFTLREGTMFGRDNNVEGYLLFVSGEQTSSLSFRFEQLDSAIDTGQELVLQFEEDHGIATMAFATANGLDVELFHILTTT
jgi:hypothetical protein